MKVYGHPISIMTSQVLCLLDEKESGAELVVIDVHALEQKQPPHLARHPFGHIPVIDDDGFWLYETPAILRYIEHTRPEPSFTPASAHDQARMDQWLCNEQAYLKPVMGKLFARIGAKIFGREDPGPEPVAQGMREIVRVFDIMAEHLTHREYLAGSKPSLADLSWTAFFPHLIEAGCGSLIAERPALSAWWDHLGQRPSWLRTRAKLAAANA
jgi:glutathione S-transferase